MESFELKDYDGNIYLRAVFDEKTPWIYAKWMGPIDVPQLQAAIEQFTEFLEKTHCPYLISDRREAKGSWFEINTWLQNVWIPKAVREGLQYVAHIVASDFQSKVSAKDLQNRILGLNFKMFENLEEAEAWLESVINENG